jgi:glycosyltransferase involved in cell wall biosynthesis
MRPRRQRMIRLTMSNVSPAAPTQPGRNGDVGGAAEAAGSPAAPRVVHLSTVHAPFNVRIFGKECRSLAAAGYDVQLVVPHERSEERGGVKVRAVPRPGNRLSRATRTVWSVARGAVRARGEIYHFHDPELIPVGIMLKAMGRRVIFDAHEDFPSQIYSKYWIPPAIRPVVSRLARVMVGASVRLLDGVVAATPAIAETFPHNRVAVVQNYPLREEIEIPESTPYEERAPVIAYAGKVNVDRSAREMVEAVGLLPAELATRLEVAGKFQYPALEADVTAMPGWDRVVFHGWQSREFVVELLRRARVGLVLFYESPNHTEAQPTKLFEYMAAGIPVVASDFPLWRAIVDESGCGLLVDPRDPRAIAGAIEWLLRNPAEAAAMGERGRRAVVERYNWDVEAQRLIDFYASIEG